MPRIWTFNGQKKFKLRIGAGLEVWYPISRAVPWPLSQYADLSQFIYISQNTWGNHPQGELTKSSIGNFREQKQLWRMRTSNNNKQRIRLSAEAFQAQKTLCKTQARTIKQTNKITTTHATCLDWNCWKMHVVLINFQFSWMNFALLGVVMRNILLLFLISSMFSSSAPFERDLVCNNIVIN